MSRVYLVLLIVCSYGFYGANCSIPCVCEDGCSCDHITGSCNHTVIEEELIQGKWVLTHFIPCHSIVAGYYGFMLVVHLSVRSSIHPSGPNLVCALILWRSDLGLLMGKFHHFLTELSARNTAVFWFQDNNLSKSEWIFTTLDMCIDMEIWFGLLMDKFHQFLTELSACDMMMAGYYGFTFLLILSMLGRIFSRQHFEIFMPPTLKKVGGAYCFWLVCAFVRLFVTLSGA